MIGHRGEAEALELLIEGKRVGYWADGSFGFVSQGAQPAKVRTGQAHGPRGSRLMYDQLDEYYRSLAAITSTQWGAIVAKSAGNADRLERLEAQVLRDLRRRLRTTEIREIGMKAMEGCRGHTNFLRRAGRFQKKVALYREVIGEIERAAKRGGLAVAASCLGSPGLARQLYEPLEEALPWRWGPELN